MIEYEVHRSSRHCAVTGRELAPGEPYYSALVPKGSSLERLDYAVESWQGPPEGAVGWWKSHQPEAGKRAIHTAPNDVMLDWFDRMADQPDQQDVRYVLALLLIRRRVFRLEETEHDAQGNEVLVVYCHRREVTYAIPAIMPNEVRIEQIQEELAKLLG